MPNEKMENAPTSAPSGEQAPQTAPTNANAKDANPNAPTQFVDPAKKFTQDDLNRIVEERVAREKESFLKKTGVSSFEELDQKLKSGDSARVKLILTQNNIAEEKQDDVITHFKGKGQALTAEALVEAVKTRPEWLKKVNVQVNSKPQVHTIGQPQNEPKERSEIADMNKAFGTHIGEGNKHSLL